MSNGTPITTDLLNLGISSHNNHYLFSDHFLNHMLKKEKTWEPYWKGIAAPAQEFLTAVTALYRTEQTALPSYSESQLEDNWFKKIFALLGHSTEGQAKVGKLQGVGVRYPDFAFFADEASRQTAAPHQADSKLYFQHATAVGEVKKWDVPLGKKVKGGEGSFDDNNPSFQIDYYVRATELAWGVLSNGRLWRLVHRDTSYKLDVYFEIDLVKAIEEQNKAAVMFFLLFFGRDSFVPKANGRTFLDEALQASRDYAQKLEADLRDNAYKALEHLIQGFIEPSGNKLTADDLPAIYTNSLYLLYRIIFLLYGESRELLPLKNQHYQKYSLTVLAREIAKELDEQRSFLTQSSQYWEQLKHLFTIMSGENEALNREMDVPRYNGGLFNPQLHPFLERYVVGDKFLVAAIDVLARRDSADPKAINPRETVDYRDLGVRQIGSIYEGLLEYQPRRAAEELVAVRKGNVEQWVPSTAKPKGSKPLETRRAGDIYLVTDKGERKATGSYYTPDYIVKYIVEQTLGPLVEEARARVKGTGKGASHAQTLAEEILRLRVLDPAMGSGHFLVESADYLARAIATDAFVQAGEGETLADDDVVFWRRQVVERCIYGVDKNRMAVELAKLSLWLVTVAQDKPLSFLDHHLRHGDSLVGARLADLGRLPIATAKNTPAPAQEQLFDEATLTRDLHLAVGGMHTIGRMLSDDIEDIHAKEEIFAELRQTHMSKWRRVADLWVSHFFGNGMTQEAWPLLVDYIQRGGETSHDVRLLLPHLEHPAVQANDFFHWELEFPEVFFDEYGRALGEKAGFDAVIGNPPYVKLQTIIAQQNSALTDFFQHTYVAASLNYDLYVLFTELGTRLCHQVGQLGYILPSKFFHADFGRGLRQVLSAKRRVRRIVDFGAQQIFEGATTYTCLLFINGQTSRLFDYHVPTNHRDLVSSKVNVYKIPMDILTPEPWQLEQPAHLALIQKLTSQTRVLGDVMQKMFVGMQTSDDAVYFVENLGEIALGLQQIRSKADGQIYPIEQSLLKPLFGGRDIARYDLPRTQKLALFPYIIQNNQAILIDHETFEREFPHGWHYLKQFESRLRQREKGAFNHEHWYRYGRTQNLTEFEQTKIMVPDIAYGSQFVLDHTHHYHTTTIYSLIKQANTAETYAYFLALLNSKISWFFVSNTGSVLRGGYYRFKTAYLLPLPIPAIVFETTGSERDAALQQAVAYYESKRFTGLLSWAEAELAQNRNDTIHDLLAYLAEQMIAMNEQKQAQTEAFWLDMEGVTDEKTLAAIRTKGKWEEAVHEKVAAARPYVRPTSRSTITLDQTLAWNEESFKGVAKMLVKNIPNFSQWVQTYRAHHGHIAPLAQRLQATDALIDQIVYRLYGLTAEEIALVEGESR